MNTRRKANRLLIFLMPVVLLIPSCNTVNEDEFVRLDETTTTHKDNCVMEHFMPSENAAMLLVDMVTYIGRKPPMANAKTRFHNEFRDYYTTYAKEFRSVYFIVKPNGTHYFYLIRPARSTKGNRRGVGGMFAMESEQILGFQELFNTPVMAEEDLEEIGWELFKAMVQNGHVDDYIDNENYVEWPDDRLKYDKELFEWRYIGID